MKLMNLYKKKKKLTLSVYILPLLFLVLQNKTCFCQCDSVVLSTKKSAEEIDIDFKKDSAFLYQQISAMLKSDQLYRGRKRIKSENFHKVDSIDNENTKKIVFIITKYGFPSKDRFHSSPGSFLPYIILLHTPIVMRDCVKVLVEREYISKRVNDFEYAHIMWHLNGRKDNIYSKSQ